MLGGTGQPISYLDIVSLYPFVNKHREYPVGVPRTLTENLTTDISQYFGLVSCDVLPPRRLLYPVLGSKINNKLIFALCFKCATECLKGYCPHPDSERVIRGTWCSVELCEAVSQSYKVVQVFEVMHFPNRSSEIFADYVDRFLKLKLESSGYPRDCTTSEQKANYVNLCKAKENITLDPNAIESNSGLRCFAKLCLNCLW